jgi:hypothetical protein
LTSIFFLINISKRKRETGESGTVNLLLYNAAFFYLRRHGKNEDFFWKKYSSTIRKGKKTTYKHIFYGRMDVYYSKNDLTSWLSRRCIHWYKKKSMQSYSLSLVFFSFYSPWYNIQWIKFFSSSFILMCSYKEEKKKKKPW